MMKICIIGNSHVASLKNAWVQMKSSHPNIEMTFFAAKGKDLSGLKCEDGVIVPDNPQLKSSLKFTSDGKEKIIPKEYDIFLVYGLNAKPYSIDDTNFSTDLLRQAVNDFVDGTLSFEVINLIRKVSDKKIFVGGVPIRSVSKTNNNRYKIEDYKLGTSIINNELYKNLNSKFIFQPDETLNENCQTLLKYSVGSVILSVRDGSSVLHSDDDNGHMNALFGKVWLESFFDQI